jgi:hypothetical protein
MNLVRILPPLKTWDFGITVRSCDQVNMCLPRFGMQDVMMCLADSGCLNRLGAWAVMGVVQIWAVSSCVFAREGIL